MILLTVTYPILLIVLGEPEVVPIGTGYLGLILLGPQPFPWGFLHRR